MQQTVLIRAELHANPELNYTLLLGYNIKNTTFIAPATSVCSLLTNF